MASGPVLAAGSPEPAWGTAAEPTFITTWNCPYAQRTWIALNEKGVSYRPVFVDLKNKPEWFFPVNEYGRVPTLVWKDEHGATASLYESLVVNEYVADAFDGPSLLPASPIERAKVRLLIDQFGAKFSPAFGKALFAATDEDAKAAATALDAAIEWLDGTLDPEGPYVTGGNFTLADAAMAPFVLRLGVLKEITGYEAPASAARLAAWREALLARPSIKASMAPPDPSRSWQEQMAETYKAYVADRRAAAAKAQ